MAIRSWLFVPGDSERKLAKVMSVGADVVIVDLEDSVANGAKPTARRQALEWLRVHRTQVLAGTNHRRWVRINPLNTPDWREDLNAIMPAGPRGIMVPKVEGPEQLRMLAAELYELEQRNGLETGITQIMPLVSESAQAAFSIPQYADPNLSMPRLAGLTWGSEDLASAVGATRKRDENGNWTDLFRMVRSQVLLAAHARGVAAIDTLHADFKDTEGLAKAARCAFKDGFSGMLAIHPDQVKIINEAFTPSEEDTARALAIIDAFAQQPMAGALQLDGEMIEKPHLDQARRLIERTQ